MSNVRSFTSTVKALVPTQDYGSIELTLSETVDLDDEDSAGVEEVNSLKDLTSEIAGIITLMNCPGATKWLYSVNKQGGKK